MGAISSCRGADPSTNRSSGARHPCLGCAYQYSLECSSDEQRG
jgi:hypothetical protein